ncbi:MAG: ABC transporter ATP-binding protein, partial [Propionibacteriaceae bacterium]
MSDLKTRLEGSEETWRSGPPPARFPDSLVPSRSGSFGSRLGEWRQRHLLRERRADEFFASAMNPVRGLPVAPARAVIGFMAGLLRSRRLILVSLLVLNGLAAVAGLAVPRLLGQVVDATDDLTTLANAAMTLSLTVAGVVVLQALLAFAARWSANVFGQDILASAREYVVRTVLGLPLGRVESASS